jgi:hypothetical protein
MTSQNNPSHIPTPAMNTDRELWRESEGDYYSPSIHVTTRGGIGINVGGTVIVRSLRDWHRLAMEAAREPTPTEDVVDEARFLCARLREWEGVCDGDECCREYSGHVSPSLARLEMLLASLKETTKDPEADREAWRQAAWGLFGDLKGPLADAFAALSDDDKAEAVDQVQDAFVRASSASQRG